jgi:hypothetical protein
MVAPDQKSSLVWCASNALSNRRGLSDKTTGEGCRPSTLPFGERKKLRRLRLKTLAEILRPRGTSKIAADAFYEKSHPWWPHEGFIICRVKFSAFPFARRATVGAARKAAACHSSGMSPKKSNEQVIGTCAILSMPHLQYDRSPLIVNALAMWKHKITRPAFLIAMANKQYNDHEK